MIIGYARVSSKTQNLDRQIKDLKQFGCDKVFQEKQSGKSFSSQPVYKELRKKLRFGDVLVVHGLSRFGRRKEVIRDEWESLMSDGIDVVVLDLELDTRKYKDVENVGQLISTLVLTLLSWMVDEDREQLRSAQREGIEIAKRQGKYKGRKKKYHENATGKDKIVYDTIVAELEKDTSVMDIHRRTGVARSTIYSIRKNMNLVN